MKTSAVFFLASRNILGRKSDARDLSRRTLRGAVLSVAFSLIPLIVTLVVSDGMINGITSRYIELSSYHVQCVPFLHRSESDISEAISALASVEGVKGVWAETQAVGIVFSRGTRTGAVVRAVEPGFLEDPGTRGYLSVISGEATLAGPNDVLLGSELARDLKAEVGSTVNLITVRSRRGDSIVPRVTIFRVRGIVSSGYRDLDSRWFIVPRSSSARYLTPETSRTVLGVKTADPYRSLEGITTRAREALPGGWGIYPWTETERNLYESFRTTRALLLLIMGLTVAVAAVNISGALITLVMERSREIAILKGLGASGADISRVFLAGGMILGFTGSVLGMAAGTFAAVHVNEMIGVLETALGALAEAGRFLAIPFRAGGGQGIPAGPVRILNPDYYLEHIPVTLDFATLAGILVVALILSFLASLLPARKAAALSPLEILRRH